MPTKRLVKDDHLIKPGGWADSHSKSGVWFSEKKSFKNRQRKVMSELKESLNWVPVEGAIMAISADPAGIVVIAPNPTLPGIMVFANGTTPANTAALHEKYTRMVRESMDAAEVPVFNGTNEPSSAAAVLN
jgi:hypothetical protein